MTKRALVLGAGGFIGGHLARSLVDQGFWVRGVDLKSHEYFDEVADDFVIGDLRDASVVQRCLDREFDEIYQLAADMGGAGYIFTGAHDADIMHDSALINLNVLDRIRHGSAGRIFYSSSACIYPMFNQDDPDNPKCDEGSAYPAQPDSEYGWEKLFSERLYEAYARNYGVIARVARFHNIFGPQTAWDNGREKAPAAITRKVIEAENGGDIEIWGDGLQTRSFLFIEDCLDATFRLLRSEARGPLNIGSEEMVTLNRLVEIVAAIGGKRLTIRHVAGPTGVRGRTSDNRQIAAAIGWAPRFDLESGLRRLYPWVEAQVAARSEARLAG